MEWLKNPVVVIDTETTGVPWMTARIVELAVGVWRPWLPMEDPQHLVTQAWLVNPGITPIPAEATAVHGITEEMVSSEWGFDRIGEELNIFVGSRAGKEFTVCAYNAPYDASVLACEFAREDIHVPAWLEFKGNRPDWIDPLVFAKQLHPFAKGKGRFKLGNVAARLGVPAGTAHRAEGDVQTTVNVMRQFAAEPDLLDGDVERLLVRQHLLAAQQEADFLRWLARQPPLPKDDNG